MKSLGLILTNPRYFGPAWVFASLNILFGTWAIYIPFVKEDLQIDKAVLGIAIFFLSLGVFTIFPVASRIINRMGVGKATWVGAILICVTAIFSGCGTQFCPAGHFTVYFRGYQWIYRYFYEYSGH